ncbi:MAG: hypothetical protein FKY71_14625, partial [Spiribacter salinus]
MTRHLLLLTFAVCAPLAAAEANGITVIDNYVSKKKPVAAGSYIWNAKQERMVVLNTHPDPDRLSKAPSQLAVHDDAVLLAITAHTCAIHTWMAPSIAGERAYIRVIGEFGCDQTDGKAGSGSVGNDDQSPQPDPDWDSNSLDVDIDEGEILGGDNDKEADKTEMDVPAPQVDTGVDHPVCLRSLPPQVTGKNDQFRPRVHVYRSHDGVDLLDANGESIFAAETDLKSRDLTAEIIGQDLPLRANGMVAGDIVFTARLIFIDPHSGYDQEFNDSIRLMVGDPKVDIDVDYDRNGRVEDDPDDAGEDAPIEYLADVGALALVNCDYDGNLGRGVRDMDDSRISSEDDLADLSPVSVEIEKGLALNETLWLVMQNPETGARFDLSFMDPEIPAGFSQVIAGREVLAGRPVTRNDRPEARMDMFDHGAGQYFPDPSQPQRYDNRFLLEASKFKHETLIHLEVRRDGSVVERDTVRVLNCPWIAYHNRQPLIAPGSWDLTGNMVNSRGFRWSGDHGATRTGLIAGVDGEFVQDSAEWGYQVRRRAQGGKAMIVVLDLHSAAGGDHPLQILQGNGACGTYGRSWHQDDESTHDPVDGDAGGNLECLPLGGPYGRLVVGDNMSSTLKGFLIRQGVQTRPSILEVPITPAGLVHVDEVLCVVPHGDSWYCAMPDWEAAMDLIGGRRVRDLYFPVALALELDRSPQPEKYGDLHKI